MGGAFVVGNSVQCEAGTRLRAAEWAYVASVGRRHLERSQLNGGNWSGQRWGGGNWNGNWRHHHHNNNDVIFIGSFGFPYRGWGWGYPGGSYGYGYPYGYDYGYGYPYGYGYDYNYGNYYGDTGYGDQGYGYSDRHRGESSVAQLQRRLASAGYYHGAIDGLMGPETRRAIRAYERSQNQREYGMTNRY